MVVPNTGSETVPVETTATTSTRASSRSASPGSIGGSTGGNATTGTAGNTGTMEPPPPAAVVVPAAAASVSAAPAIPVSKRRGGKTIVSHNPLDAVTAAALTSAIQYMTSNSFHGLASLLTNVLQEGQQHATLIPPAELVQTAAKKAITDQPAWVHWSKQDMAPQFKCDGTRLTLTGAMRGYRMARASHGVSTGYYYYECIILPGPSAAEILQSLPPNARLGPGLREQLQQAMQWEETQKAGGTPSATQSEGQIKSSETGTKKRKAEQPPPNVPPQVGGHVRIGWSMRTGDLQAPVGYDKWSYGIRDVGGSIIHCSQRQDDWGGDGFSTNDVLGCAICFDENDTKHIDEEEEYGYENNNHIRFFKNADSMGHFVLTKGKREGGEAFRNIERGIYYPAVSSYMGGSVRVNFGPYWVCPPKRSRLPVGLKNLKPMSSVLEPPPSPEEAVSNAAATVKLFRKAEHQQALREAVQAEAEVQCQAYSDFLKNHVEEIRLARLARGLSVADLPDAESLNKDSGVTAMETND